MPTVQLSPMSSRRCSVGAADDPYKRYWWAILGGFVMTGAWLCLPIMETPVGSAHVDTSAKAGAADAANSEQSLDAADNPSGAAGGALSMDGATHKRKSGDEDMTSMLFQAPPDAGAAASGKPLADKTAASSASLAQQLKDAGKKTDASGWGGEKAQRGFAAPHLAGGSLSGVGSASGGSSASAGGASAGAFGSRNADVGFGKAQGLRDDGSASAGLNALKAAAGSASPNLKGNNEDMKAGGNSTFDGSRGKPGAGIGMDGGAMAQAGAVLDAAPADLKANDPKLDAKKLPDPPSVAPPTASGDAAMAKQMMMMLAMTVVGGMVGGMAGQMIMMAGTQLIQQQAQQKAADDAKAQQATAANRLNR